MILDDVETIARDLGARCEQRVHALKLAYLDGSIGSGELIELCAAIIVQFNAQGLSAGAAALDDYLDQSAAEQLTTGEPVDAPAEPATVNTESQTDNHYLDGGRLTAGVTTVVTAGNLDTGDRLERLARSEPLEAVQTSFHSRMINAPRVKGWQRQLDADPCELCQHWASGNTTWPPFVDMPKHKGCACMPRPVVHN